MDYQTNRFDTNTFLITSVVLLIFIIMVVCFLRVFMRFLQNNYVSKDHLPDRQDNGSKVSIPERRIVRGSNTSLHSTRSIRQNTQPVRQYSKYKITKSVDTVDQTGDFAHASESLLRHNHIDATVPSARPPSYQEAMASSRENLTDLCEILNGK